MFPSSDRIKVKIKAVPTLLRPLERKSLDQLFLRHPTEYGPPLFYMKTETDPVSETLFLENIKRWTKSKNMIYSSAIHHRHNPLELMCSYNERTIDTELTLFTCIKLIYTKR
jgi:hypothetical protein